MTQRQKTAPPTTPWHAMLRGRLASVGLLDAKEQALYSDSALPTTLLAGYTIGATADPAAPILSEIELGVQIAQLLAPVADADPLVEADRVLSGIDGSTLTIEVTAEQVTIRGTLTCSPDAAVPDPDPVPRVVLPEDREQVGV